MTNYKMFTSFSKDELVAWLANYCHFDSSPWMEWFDDTYCNKCEPIECTYVESEEKLGIKPFYERSIKCTYCELEHKCKYFPDMSDIPDNKDIIRMWLEQEH